MNSPYFVYVMDLRAPDEVKRAKVGISNDPMHRLGQLRSLYRKRELDILCFGYLVVDGKPRALDLERQTLETFPKDQNGFPGSREILLEKPSEVAAYLRCRMLPRVEGFLYVSGVNPPIEWPKDG